jgi:flagellar biosynthetic protein FliQ
MTEAAIAGLAFEALRVALVVALPVLGAMLLVGLAVNILQVATSLQDTTLTFIPKIAAAAAALYLAGPWMLRVLVAFAVGLFARIPGLFG